MIFKFLFPETPKEVLSYLNSLKILHSSPHFKAFCALVFIVGVGGGGEMEENLGCHNT